MPQTIALYARVSTDDQTTEPQLDQLRAYAARRHLEAVEFIDEGHSGRGDRRPGLDALLAAVRRRDVDAVVITKLDRLLRSTRHLTALAAELEALGVDLVVLDQEINTATPAGRLLFNVLAAIGEFEGDLIRDRTRAGVEAARRRGRHPGRPRVLDRPTRARVEHLRGSGKSIRAIADLVGVSKSVIARELKAVG